MVDITKNVSEGTLELPSVSAPGTTTDKLYNEGGVLTFDGVSLEGGGGAVTGIADTDGDTSIETETSDDDFIRFDTGDTPVGYPAAANVMTLA